MAFHVGLLSAPTIGFSSVSLVATAAAGGTSPYTYQWYRSQSQGFSPGGGTLMTGKTGLVFTDDTVLPGNQYYYKVIVTDTGHSNDVLTYVELSVLTNFQNQLQNQFVQSPFLGMLDLRYNYNTISVQIGASESSELMSGQPVLLVQDAGKLPQVEACSANTNETFGFLNYNIKSKKFVAGDIAEISQRGNVMYLVSTAAIARGARLMIDVATPGGVITATSAKPVIGFALDLASASGQLIRVELMTPAFELFPT